MTARKKVVAAAVTAMTLATCASASDQQTMEVEAKAPQPIDCKPRYPEAALRAHVQGVSTLAFHVAADGKVTQVDIVAPSGPTREHRLLDHAAASALALCPFKPAKDENGNPVESVMPVKYAWRLE